MEHDGKVIYISARARRAAVLRELALLDEECEAALQRLATQQTAKRGHQDRDKRGSR